MSRRLVGMALALTVLTAPAVGAPPNVVLIISDDHAWTDYGFMGHPRVKTPRIDRLAGESLVYRRGYVPSSLCSPSLATILSGLFPHQHGVTSNDPPAPGSDPSKPAGKAARDNARYREDRRAMIANFDRVPTLPRLLGEGGYVSLQTGKWWGGHYSHGGFTEGMSHGDAERGGRHGDEGLAIGRETMQPIFEFIDRSVGQGKPFFVWYAPMLPHLPHNPPERLLAKYRDQAPSLPIARYWATIEWFDETCGQLLDYLADRKLAENTLVIYITDNGWIQNPKGNGAAPRSKQSPYDGGLRTPILIRWPGKVAPRESDGLASSIDVAPTILAAAGLKPPAGMPGINLLDESAVGGRKAIFGECFTHNAVDIRRPETSLRFRWVVTGDEKLILPTPRHEPDAQVELFNIVEDPLERKNLASEKPAEVERLTKLINDWWPASPRPEK